MNKPSSDSDESIEHMKLDLLKAKYLHQKLNKNITKVIKPKKGYSNPKFSSSKMSQNESISLQSMDNIIYQDKSEDSNNSEYCEYEDIAKMNKYADYILDKKRLPLYADNKDSNDTSSLLMKQQIRTSQDPTSDGYLKDNDEICTSYNPSTDILAQWRLRRKLSEAKHSIISEHQKHSLRINKLNSNFPKMNSTSSALHKNHNISEEYEFDEVPVRDVILTVEPVKVNNTFAEVIKSDSSCQCNFDVIFKEKNIINEKEGITVKDAVKEKIKGRLGNETKTKHLRKSKRTIGIMTTTASHAKSPNLVDCSTQTLSFDRNVPETSEFIIWPNQNSEKDYIDIAIQKTLQHQLFDRNCNSALSTITSINDSKSCHSIPQLEIDLQKDDSDSNLVNGDNVTPWNEDFQIESDCEFKEDDMLIDLRRRRALNLEKLRVISHKIRDFTGKVPAIELS